VSERPKLKLAVSALDADSLLAALHAHELDFFAAAEVLIAPDPRLEINIVADYRIGIFVRIGHPLCGRRKLSREDVAAFPMASGAAPHAFNPAAGGYPLPFLEPTIVCENYDMLGQVTASSDLIWTTAPALAERIAPGRLVELEIDDEALVRAVPIAVVRLRRRTLPPASLLIKDWLESCLRCG
jgi:DNA-binding transcriptional LysR family regulator